MIFFRWVAFGFQLETFGRIRQIRGRLNSNEHANPEPSPKGKV